MASQVAGPSRLAFNHIPEPRSIEERQRLLASNKKAERVLGATAPASVLDLHSKALKAQAGAIVLNSPISSAPPSAFRWDTRMYTNFADRPLSSSGSTESLSMPPSPSGAHNYVPPLNFKRDSSRANSNSSSAEAELLEFRRDLSNLSLNGSSSSHEDRTDHLARSDSFLRRHPRPLPPVPPCASRSASPVSSSSLSNTPPGPMRPLPPPPDHLSRTIRPVSRESVSTIGFAPPSPHLKCLIPNASTTSLTLSPIEDEEAPEKDAPSPISMVSEATDTLSILTPKFGMFMHSSNGTCSPLAGTSAVGSSTTSGADRKQKHGGRVHASPYKLARSASRYSVTSLSSQVSVPPVPPAEELRRRNREKMSKLIRMLGDSPPADMVFAIESAYAELQASLDKEVEMVKTKHVEDSKAQKISKPKVEFTESPLIERPSTSSSLSAESKSHGRSISLTNDFDSVYTKKSLTDPDAGHLPLSPINSRTTFTTNTTSNTVSPFARLRQKKGRQGASAERYVVSLAGGDAERVSLRLAGSGAIPNRRQPTGSYLRGAYKSDTRTVEVKVPPLPKTRVSLLAAKAKLNLPQEKADKVKDTRKWLRDAGSTRWEVEDYENVVKSLRKL